MSTHPTLSVNLQELRISVMLVTVGASRSHCQPPSVRLEIDFDLQFGRPFPHEYQEDDQQQKVHKQHFLSTSQNVQTPPVERGFAFWSPALVNKALRANYDSATPAVEGVAYPVCNPIVYVSEIR